MNIICNFCGSTKASKYLTVTDHRLNIPGEWDLYKCTNCGLIFIWPQPDWNELSLHYPKEYHGYITSKSRLLNIFRKYGLAKRTKSIQNFKSSNGILLDIGCASGDFLEEFRNKTGWEVIGIEIIEDAVKVAQEKKITIIKNDLISANLKENTYDVITLWDVLEHLPDPSAVLIECNRILKDDGLLVIKTPDPSGIEASMFGKYWVGYEAPQHLFIFPRNVLINFLEKTDFRIKKLSQTGSDYAAPLLSLSFILSDHGQKKLASSLVKFSRSIIGRVFLMFLIKPFRTFGIRSSCTYYATKIRK